MRRHIERVGAEFPTMEPDLMERIYEQLVVALLRQPTEDEYRARVAELSRFDDATVRCLHGLSPKSGARASGGRRRTAVPVPAETAAGGRQRHPGRPKGTRSVSRDQIIEAFQTFRAMHHRRPTQVQLAANLKPPVAVRTLQALLAGYGLPWPIE
jgi:hypothetical protein